MIKKLSFRDYLFIGSMLFGLSFSAGNPILSIHLSREVGAAISWANLGFLATDTGLPFLGVIVISVSKSSSVRKLAKWINQIYAMVFIILLHLIAGPLFALLRLATTPFEIGLAPLIDPSRQALYLTIFGIVLSILTWWLSRKPAKILDYIGKPLNPASLALLGALLLLAFLNPLGSVN